MNQALTAAVAMRALLLRLGMIFGSPKPEDKLITSGIQIDINVVLRETEDGRIIEASLCNHDCTEKHGGYLCPAAYSQNKGAKPSFAKATAVIHWLLIAREGILKAQRQYQERFFEQYCTKFEIPSNVREVLIEAMLSDLVEVNLFGGNPEMHPEILLLISELKRLGFRVNLTTTGLETMRSANFREGLQKDGPHLLALSADDFDIRQVDTLLSRGREGIFEVWKSIPAEDHGQERKFLEALWNLDYAREIKNAGGSFPPILLNLVIHKKNLRQTRQIIAYLQGFAPWVIVNPYPAQSSFLRKDDRKPEEFFNEQELEVFRTLVHFFTEQASAGNTQLTRRQHYWMVMESVFQTYRDRPDVIARRIAGYGIWHCAAFPSPGYLQISKSNPNHVQIHTSGREPGGVAGCFWDDETSVNAIGQISSPDQVASYLLGGRQAMLRAAPKPCAGCSMPRLWFHFPETESKMDPLIWTVYRRLRQQIVGF